MSYATRPLAGAGGVPGRPAARRRAGALRKLPPGRRRARLRLHRTAGPDLGRASRRPVFGLIHEDLGAGILGGELVSMETAGKVSAELGAPGPRRRGRRRRFPLVADAGLAPMFDARELERWGALASGRSRPAAWCSTGSRASSSSTGGPSGSGSASSRWRALLVAGLVLQLRRRRRIERELARAETRYRTVADFTHDWEFWRRPDGRFEYVSPACEQVSGHTASELPRGPRAARPAGARGGPPRLAAALEPRRRTPARRLRSSSGSARRDGEVRWVRFASQPGPARRTAPRRGSGGASPT